MRTPALPRVAADPMRVELVLRLADGRPWRLTVSRGIERFIGHYPRLDGIDSGEPLLRFVGAS
ncbi:MAG TPA: hypothetical protein VEA60_00805 [Allosphingosinicella sp.]|nr:hypothetical protein [Allosphingosinicella sp.]